MQRAIRTFLRVDRMIDMKTFIALTLLLSLGLGAAEAATVYLRDGGRLQGTIVKSDAQGVQLNTGTMTVTISADRIDHIDYAQSAPAPAPEAVPAPAPSAPPSAYPPPPRRRIYRVRPISYEEGPNEISLDIGASVPISNISFSGAGGGSDHNGDAGVLAGIQWIHYLDSQLGIGADFHYLGRSWSDSQNLIANAETNVAGGSAVFMGVMKFRIVPDGPVRPYLLGGIGVHNTSETVDVTPNFGTTGWPGTNSFETRRLYDATSTGLASTVKFGLDFPSFPPAFVGFDLGWTGLFNGKYNPTTAGSNFGLGTLSGTLNIFTVGAHAGWRF